MRDPARIDSIIEALREAWKQAPDERLGQLLDNFCVGEFDIPRDKWYCSNLRNREDDKWLQAIKARKFR